MELMSLKIWFKKKKKEKERTEINYLRFKPLNLVGSVAVVALLPPVRIGGVMVVAAARAAGAAAKLHDYCVYIYVWWNREGASITEEKPVLYTTTNN